MSDNFHNENIAQITEFPVSTEKKYYMLSFLLVLMGGILWSFGSIIVRYMETPEYYRWQYLFYRGLGLSFTLIIYQATIFKNNVFKKIYDVGWNGLIGGVALGFSSILFVFSITQTTVAVTMFMIALGPLMTAVLSRIVLQEKIKTVTLISMIAAFSGCIILVINQYQTGSLIGAVFGFFCTFFFSAYTVSIRWKSGIPKPRTTIIGGFITAIFAIGYLGITSIDLFSMPLINVFYSLLHGIIVAIGLIMFMFGARFLMAAELVLLSMLEVVAGIVWSWIPFFGINETITLPSLIGGSIILISIIFRTIALNEKRPYFRLKKKYQIHNPKT